MTRPRKLPLDVSRDPLKLFDAARVLEGTNTLRTTGSHLWVLPSAQAASTFGHRGRFLTRSEKARCAGIVPESLSDLTDAEFETAIGNTIPVPLIGTIMYPVLRAWVEYHLSLRAGP